MLLAQGKYNQLSPQLRKELEDKAAKLGRFIKYKFAIAKKNPDGEKRTGGEYLYPLLYTLTPVTYQIRDPYDLQLKNIGMVARLKEMGAQDDSFRRLQVKEGWQGVYTLDMNKPEDQEVFAWLEMHPKLEGGKFRDTNIGAVVTMVDDLADAKRMNIQRNLRIDAMFVASNFTEKQQRDFAAAMGWNEHEDSEIIKNSIVSLAEQDPEFFRDFVDNKKIEYRAVLKRAMDNNIIAYVPVESKVIWNSNRQTIAILERVETNNLLDRLSDWVLTSKNGMDVYNKIRGMLSEKTAEKK